MRHGRVERDGWERPQRDRPEDADAQAVRAGAFVHGARDARGGAVGDDHDLRVLELLGREADLALGDLRILGLQVVVVLLQVGRLEVERAHDARRSAGGATERPL